MMKSPLLLKNVFIKVHLNLRNMNNVMCPQEQFIVFYIGRSERCILVYLGLMIFPCGMFNKQEMVGALNRTETFKTDLQGQNVVTLVTS